MMIARVRSATRITIIRETAINNNICHDDGHWYTTLRKRASGVVKIIPGLVLGSHLGDLAPNCARHILGPATHGMESKNQLRKDALLLLLLFTASVRTLGAQPVQGF